ncbi:hypothetical protein KP509_10G025300 [Ceratopteris richardii]|uniref:Uncharacterized protein n=1 Tax=Ceratopteris richardii TaxID=49495 RepID=A0A8T2U053_CERRI|nr:hypothetical protein KP509_10G025300 [Ceratopteris richardii]
MGRTGGPLLCVDDLMQDLILDGSDHMQSISSTPQTSTPRGSGADLVIPTCRNLEEAFEHTYLELESALRSSGHSWTSLTQQLYGALTSANQVVAAANSNLSFIADKIVELKSALERGDAVINDLRAVLAELQIHST